RDAILGLGSELSRSGLRIKEREERRNDRKLDEDGDPAGRDRGAVWRRRRIDRRTAGHAHRAAYRRRDEYFRLLVLRQDGAEAVSGARSRRDLGPAVLQHGEGARATRRVADAARLSHRRSAA